MTHGSNKIDVELSNTVRLIQAYRCIKYLMHPERPLNNPQWHTHGPSVTQIITDSDLDSISYATKLTKEQLLGAHTPVFSRCKINDEVFTSQLYTRQKKRSNFHIKYKVNESVFFGTIKYFIKIEGNLYGVVRQLVVTNDSSKEIKNIELGYNFDETIKHVRDSYCTHVITLNKILSKILRVENYVCIFLNNMEKK